MKANIKPSSLIRCPRCELNYIQKKDKFCAICKQEMKPIAANHLSVVDELEVCPICRTNLIHADQIMCVTCSREKRYEDSEDAEFIRDDWDDYANQTEDEELGTDEDLEEGMRITDLDDEDLLDTSILPDADLDLEDDELVEEEFEEDDLEDDFDEIDEDDDDFEDDDFEEDEKD